MSSTSRILLAGLCPLPFENTSQNYGPGIRTWQMARGLAARGHEVRVLAMVIPQVYEAGELAPTEEVDGMGIRRLESAEFLDAATLRRELETFRPDAVVGATVYGSLALVRTATELPLWADQFGHVMAEAQAKARLESDNWPVARWWRMAHPVMSRADKVSVVSERQRYAAIGELGAVGRLTAETCGYEFTSVIACGLNPPPRGEVLPGVRGSAVPEDAFIVLWSGGFNVWSDVDTLFEGVEAALEAEPSMHFVATGGAIEGHDSSTYERFRERVAASRHAARYHLQGWVKRERVPGYVAEADVGVLTDRSMYEGELGSKNRLVEWMAWGLPVAYNRQGDIGRLLADEALGLTFEMGDARGLAERLLWAARHREELAILADRARAHALREFSFEATTRELASWAAQPERAPDAFLCEGPRSPLDFEEPDPEAVAQRARGAAARHGLRSPSIWSRAWKRLLRSARR